MNMLKMRIARLSIKDFKGIKSLEINLHPEVATIRGENATGKTTIVDAFNWLLFDKDSTGRSDFSIKPYSKDGGEVHYLESIVEADLMLNDEKITLKKVFREKWTKPRGQAKEVFSGHETTYFLNDVPLKKLDYDKRINEICPEDVFKLLTNPQYFPRLPWQKQRQMLFDIAGDVSDADIISVVPAYAELLKSINGHKSMDDYKKMIAAQKRKIKDELDTIPARIDEVQKAMPAPLMWDQIEKGIQSLNAEIQKIDDQITDAGKALEGENSKRIELQGNIDKLISLRFQLEREAQQVADNLKYEFDRTGKRLSAKLSDNTASIIDAKQRINNAEAKIDSLKAKKEAKKNEWYKINAETFIFEDDGICPHCGQPLPEEMLSSSRQDHENKFNALKADRLAENVKEGRQYATEITSLEETIKVNQEIICALESENEKLKEPSAVPDYESAKSKYLAQKEYLPLVDKIDKMIAEMAKLGPVKITDTSAYQERRKALVTELDQYKTDLATRERIDAGNKRIVELTNTQQELSHELANLENIEISIQQSVKAKIELIESRINGMFEVVRFKMYNQQVNGGEQETCECTVDGVPYSDVNNAGKINAGMDIVSVLSAKYGIYAPVWIDNRESVNDLKSIPSQVINLVVTTDKQLVIN